MCADELKESREMPLKSCLRCPFSFKCPLVWAGPGFKGSHGNPDSELFFEEILEYWPWVKERQIFLQLFFSSQLGLFEILTTQWAHGGVCPLGRLATDEAEKWRLSVWICDWPVCSYWHATLLPLQLPALTTSQRQRDERDVCTSISTKIYLVFVYEQIQTCHCKLIHNQSSNQPIFHITFLHMIYTMISRDGSHYLLAFISFQTILLSFSKSSVFKEYPVPLSQISWMNGIFMNRTDLIQ